MCVILRGNKSCSYQFSDVAPNLQVCVSAPLPGVCASLGCTTTPVIHRCCGAVGVNTAAVL